MTQQIMVQETWCVAWLVSETDIQKHCHMFKEAMRC
jgi:hypothetical protein